MALGGGCEATLRRHYVYRSSTVSVTFLEKLRASEGGAEILPWNAPALAKTIEPHRATHWPDLLFPAVQ